MAAPRGNSRQLSIIRQYLDPKFSGQELVFLLCVKSHLLQCCSVNHHLIAFPCKLQDTISDFELPQPVSSAYNFLGGISFGGNLRRKRYWSFWGFSAKEMQMMCSDRSVGLLCIMNFVNILAKCFGKTWHGRQGAEEGLNRRGSQVSAQCSIHTYTSASAVTQELNISDCDLWFSIHASKHQCYGDTNLGCFAQRSSNNPSNDVQGPCFIEGR